MREFSVPPVVTIGDAATLTDPVWDNADAAADVVQFTRRVGGTWQDVTCAQFRDEVVALVRGLINAGIEAGERVGLMSKTRYEWTLIDYAIWACGAVTVPIYETSSAEQVAWILADSGAVACFVETDQHRQLVSDVRDQLPDLEHLWQIEADGGRGAVEELVADGAAIPAEEVEQRRHAIGADDVATIIYTSGTTGRPKGCVLTHRNMYSDIANAIPGLNALFHEGASTLLFLPLAHSFARLIQIGVVQARARMGHTADIKNLVDNLKDFQPTFVLAVPRVFEKVYNTARQQAHADGKGAIFDRAERVAIAYSEALDRRGGPGLLLRAQHALFDRLVYGKLRAALGGRCRDAIAGGAPLGERLAHFFRGVGVTVYEGYGLTETSPLTHANPIYGVRKPGSIGIPVPDTEARLVDLETGMPLPSGAAEAGELAIRGPQVMRGYWNRAEDTADCLSADGWLCTGDICTVDDDGYFSIVDRKKDMIIASGYKILPREVEEVLFAHPAVQEAAVVGVPDPYRCETVKAFIVPKASMHPTVEELITHCRASLAPYKVPRLIEFRAELPKTAIGKVLPRVLAAEEQQQSPAQATDAPSV